ncbi:hypothetical protein CDAR_563621 [Caerostris darwini]|uniref:Uncharacterized protein n=1 Tax=Caerostris darwini TaxID=1538125 RepID=A0AAV4PHK1_9ARAC|nr:hypothetical protein CDAR_563621 [Caerostris darwini]
MLADPEKTEGGNGPPLPINPPPQRHKVLVSFITLSSTIKTGQNEIFQSKSQMQYSPQNPLFIVFSDPPSTPYPEEKAFVHSSSFPNSIRFYRVLNLDD